MVRASIASAGCTEGLSTDGDSCRAGETTTAEGRPSPVWHEDDQYGGWRLTCAFDQA